MRKLVRSTGSLVQREARTVWNFLVTGNIEDLGRPPALVFEETGDRLEIFSYGEHCGSREDLGRLTALVFEETLDRLEISSYGEH